MWFWGLYASDALTSQLLVTPSGYLLAAVIKDFTTRYLGASTQQAQGLIRVSGSSTRDEAPRSVPMLPVQLTCCLKCSFLSDRLLGFVRRKTLQQC